MVAAPTVATQAVAPVAVAPMVVAASQGLKPKPSASPRVRVRASAALPLPPLPPPPPGHVGVYVLPAADPVPDRVLVPKPRDQARCRSAWKRLLGHQRKLLPKGSASVQCQSDAGLSSSVGVREKKVFCAASWASLVAKVWFSVRRVASAVRKG